MGVFSRSHGALQRQVESLDQQLQAAADEFARWERIHDEHKKLWREHADQHHDLQETADSLWQHVGDLRKSTGSSMSHQLETVEVEPTVVECEEMTVCSNQRL